MNRAIKACRVVATGLLASVLVNMASATCFGQDQPDRTLKAGTASVVITPDYSTWMAGYAARTKPSEGKAQDLFAKALALEDAQGSRLVIVTTDLASIPRTLRDNVAKEVAKRHRLEPQFLLMNASHTHSGPVLTTGRSALHDLDQELVKKTEKYVGELEQKLVKLVGQALEKLAPARLGYSHARAGFAMNRRIPSGKDIRGGPNPDGVVDHNVPVLRVDSPEGKLRAVVFGYACHNTTLGPDFYQFCGDYAGFAQQYLEEAHPGATALFLTGCGGDQNPYPRGTLGLAREHGRTLANAVQAALLPKPRPVRGLLQAALEEVTLEFAPPPSRDELLQRQQSPDKYRQRHATRLLEELTRMGQIRTTYSCQVQVVLFGGDLILVALPGEPVADYSLRLKRELEGPAVWVAGYCNEGFAYIPSVRVLKEGGYEGGEAMIYGSLPGPFAPSVEERVVGKVQDLVKRARGEKKP